jgi:chromatin remodeling complex protein RSC6
MKPMQPSEHLAKIVGTEPLPRSEVTKKIWAHIKKHKLQNPKNKREILADDKLQPIFGSKKLDMFQMAGEGLLRARWNAGVAQGAPAARWTARGASVSRFACALAT